MNLKFMPQMPAIRVAGTPTTDAIVSTLKMSFSSMVINPKDGVK